MLDTSWIPMMGQALLETLYMTLGSALFSYILGMPIGILLTVSAKDGLKPNGGLFSVLNAIVNVVRSAPFIILLITVLPLTRLIIGTTIGPTAMLVSLTLAAAPFAGRMVESSLREIDSGVIEAAQSMGVSPARIVFQVMLPEALPSLISGAATVTVSILGYSAMAGTVGGGGLGDLAIRYGYHRYQYDVMISTLVLMVLVVQLLQWIGNRLSMRLDKRKIPVSTSRRRKTQ